MTLKQEIEIIKARCGKMCLGNGKCYHCHAGKSARGFVIHHRWYLTDGDVIRTDPKYQPVNDSTTLLYYQDLEPLIKKTPKRFMYLCNPHHHALTKAIRYNDKNWNRLSLLRRMSRKP